MFQITYCNLFSSGEDSLAFFIITRCARLSYLNATFITLHVLITFSEQPSVSLTILLPQVGSPHICIVCYKVRKHLAAVTSKETFFLCTAPELPYVFAPTIGAYSSAFHFLSLTLYLQVS